MGDLAVFAVGAAAAAVAEGEGFACGDLNDVRVIQRDNAVTIQTERNVRGDLDRSFDPDVIGQIQVPSVAFNCVKAAAARDDVPVVFQLLVGRIIGQLPEGQIGVRAVRAVRADADRMLMRLAEVQLKMIALKLDAVHNSVIIIVNVESRRIVLGQFGVATIGKGDRARCGHAFQRDADLLLLRGEAAGDPNGFVTGQIDIAGFGHAAVIVVLDRHFASNFEIAVHVHAAAADSRSVEFVSDDLSSTGSATHTEGAVGANIYAAALYGRVALVGRLTADRAAVHGKRAAHVHAAAVTAVTAGFVAGNAAAVHGKRAAAVNTHAAAVSADAVGFVTGNAAAGHSKRGTSVNTHTAALFGGVALAGFRAADHALGHGERAAVYAYAAAVFGGCVIVDITVVHRECAGKHIYAAAVVSGRVAVDIAAVHGEVGRAVHVHAAASLGGRVFGDLRIAGHGEAVQGIGRAAAIHIHAAAAAVVGRVFGDDSIAGQFEFAAAYVHTAAAEASTILGDDAAKHDERGVWIAHIHAAAVIAAACRVAADLTAVHGEDGGAAFFPDVHAAALDIGFVGDLAVVLFAALAVGQGEGAGDVDHFALGFHRDAVPVEVKHRAVRRRPRGAELHVRGQVVVALSHVVAETGNARPSQNIIGFGVIAVRTARTTNGVRMRRGELHFDGTIVRVF